MNEIVYKDLRLTHIVKKGLKNSYISVRHTQELKPEILLKTPRLSEQMIVQMLQQKESWIRLQISKILQNPPKQIKLEDEVQLFGTIYSIDHPLANDLRTQLAKVQTQNLQKVLSCYDAFYKQISQTYLQKRTEFFAQKMGLCYQELRYKKMKSRWGSCSSLGVITFNTQLLKVERSLIDYVVVHELAHLKYMNHSKAFHSLVREYLPDADQRRKKLKTITLV